MTTYYVDLNATGGSTGADWTNAFTTIQASIDAATTAGDVVYVSAGTYNEDIDTKWNGTAVAPIKIRASKVIAPNDSHAGQVLVDGVGITDANALLYMAHDYNYFYGIDLNVVTLNSRAVYNPAGGDYGHIFDSVITSEENLYIDGFIEYTRCIFKGFNSVNGKTYSISIDSDTSSFNMCQFTAHDTMHPHEIRLRNASTGNFNNCVFSGFFGRGFILSGTATLNLNNPIIESFNVRRDSANDYFIKSIAGTTVNVANAQHLPYWEDQLGGLHEGAGTFTNTNAVDDKAIGFTTSGVDLGALCFTVDDGSTATMQYVADLLAALDTANGEVFTWFTDIYRMENDTVPSGYANWQELAQAVVDAGCEVANGGYDGSILTATTTFTVTGTGTTPTIDVDIATDTITCTDASDGGGTVTGFLTKTTQVIRAEIDAFTAFSTATGNSANYEPGWVIGDTSGAQACSVDYTVPYNLTGADEGWYYFNLGYANSLVEAGLDDYTIKTMSYPGGSVSNALATAVKDSGLIGARKLTRTSSSENLASANLYRMVCYEVTDNMFTSLVETALNKQGLAVATTARSAGNISCILSHNATEISVAEAGYFLKDAATTGYVMTFGDAVAEYRANANTTNVDGEAFTNTLQDVSDLTLLSTANGIGTGMKWWAGANPVGTNGEPFSDFDTDIGVIQSTSSPFHPVNL